MTIDEFEAIIHRDIQHFVSDWKEKHKEMPESWPLLDMPIEEWQSQFNEKLALRIGFFNNENQE